MSRRARLQRLGLGNWFTDLVYNAATGNLTQAQLDAAAQQAAADHVKAGMDPAIAQQVAINDVNAAVTTFQAPGAFGVIWQGAQPGGTNWLTQAEANIANSAFGQGQWVWWALGGIGALFLLTRLK